MSITGERARQLMDELVKDPEVLEAITLYLTTAKRVEREECARVAAEVAHKYKSRTGMIIAERIADRR